MSWYPAGVRPKVSRSPTWGGKLSPAFETEDLSELGSPMECRLGEIPDPRTIPLGEGRLGPDEPLLVPLGEELSEERHTGAALATSVPWHPAPRGAGSVRVNQKGQWNVSSESNRSTSGRQYLPYQLHYLWMESPFSWASTPALTRYLPPSLHVLEYKLLSKTGASLSSEQDLLCPPEKGPRMQPALAIYVRDYRCVVCAE